MGNSTTRRSRFLPVLNGKNYFDQLKTIFGSSLKGHWKLDEGSGGQATDSSGNGYHGSYNAMTLAGDYNPFTKHVTPVWDGSTGHYVVLNGSGAPCSLDEGSFVFFAKPDASIIPGTSSRTMVYFQTSGGSTINIAKTGSAHEFFFGRYTGGTYRPYQHFSGVYEARWHHWVVSWSVAGGKSSIYLNGYPIYVDLAMNTSDATAMSQFIFGASGASNGPWYGSLSDVTLLDRAASAAEAFEAYKAGMGGNGPKTLTVFGDSLGISKMSYANHFINGYGNRRTILRNRSVGGVSSAYLSTMAAAGEHDNADLVFIELGLNDDNAGNMTTLQAALEANLIQLKVDHPRARIYYLNVPPKWTDATGTTEVDKSNVRAAIAAACAAQSVTCWDLYTTPWFEADETSDGTHPLSAGYYKIANEILARVA